MPATFRPLLWWPQLSKGALPLVPLMSPPALLPVPIQPMSLPASRLKLMMPLRLLPISQPPLMLLFRCWATPPIAPHPPAALGQPTLPVPAARPTTTPRRH